jgi:hypothetical protein
MLRSLTAVPERVNVLHGCNFMSNNDRQNDTLRLIFEELVKIREKLCGGPPDAIARVSIADFFNEYGDLLPDASIVDDGSPVPEDAADSIALANSIYAAFIAALGEFSSTDQDLEWLPPPPPP